MNTIETLLTRRSCRSYLDKAIEQDKIDTILKCGTYAPSGRGRQASYIVCIQDPQTQAQIRKINAQIMGVDSDPFYGAPCIIIVLADPNIVTYQYDGTCVMDHMMIAAHELGLASCWIHRAKETFETELGKQLLRKWGLSEDLVGIGNIALGYANGELPQAKMRKDNYITKV